MEEKLLQIINENKEAVVNNHHVEQEFVSNMANDKREELMAGWHDAIKATNVNR